MSPATDAFGYPLTLPVACIVRGHAWYQNGRFSGCERCGTTCHDTERSMGGLVVSAEFSDSLRRAVRS